MKNRVLVAELPKLTGKSASVSGWLFKRRLLGGLNFLVLRDRTGIVQLLLEDENELKKLEGLQLGTVLTVTGEVLADERAPGGVEIHCPKLEIITPVSEVMPIEIDKPISHKPEHLETLFDNREVTVRNLQEQKIFRIRSEVTGLIRQFLLSEEFVEIHTPKLLAEATEGGAEVFKLEYFGKQATLAQSPQFYKQMMVGAFERVFEIAPAYRAEPSATTRHVTEVTMLDIEIAFVENHDDVLNIIQKMVYSVLTELYKSNTDNLTSLQAPDLVIKDNFPRYTVAEIHEMYSKANKTDTTGEKDLTPDEERWICEYAKKNDGCELVYATELPLEAHKFYQMINPENPQTVLAADLLFRGVELATCPMREHRYEKMVAQMKAKGMDPSHPGFSHYLNAFKYGLPPHGGCGFGLDRFVQKIVGLNNIKEAILFPRDIHRLTP